MKGIFTQILNNSNKAIAFHFLAISLACSFSSCGSDQDEKIMESNPTVVSHIIPNYYARLFKTKTKEKLKLINSYENLGRDTICNFLYDEKYYMQVYKISGSYFNSLRNTCKETVGENEMETGTMFNNNQTSLLTIREKTVVSQNDLPSPNIYISFGGKEYSINKKNDSLADYFSTCKNLSIKYKVNGPQEIFVETKGSDKQNIPFELMLVKNSNNLFFVLLSPKTGLTLFPNTLGLTLLGSVTK